MVLYTFGVSNNNYYFRPIATRVENKTVITVGKIGNFFQQRLNQSGNMHDDRKSITRPATTATTRESRGASVDITMRYFCKKVYLLVSKANKDGANEMQ